MLIRHLSYFVTLAREKHYARAAAACNIAQPTLSAAIRKLEEDLQVQLVLRGHRFVGLTSDGETVLQWGQRMLADYAGMREGLSGAHTGLSGLLRFGVIPSADPAAAQLTAQFSTLHPAVCINIQSMSSRAIQRGLDAFEIDAALTYLDNEPLENIRQIPLYRERYVFVTRRGNRHAERSSITWAEAAQEQLCLLGEDMQNRRIIDRIASLGGLRLEARIVSNSYFGICAQLMQGECASIVPHTFLSVFGSTPELIAIEFTETAISHSIGLAVSSRDPRSPVINALIALVTQLNQRLG
ncbi:MAG TPA: LysR family transcriptional regulator [Acidocella sp.]|nr:LysR family transcriptional regulator [Acidocella sp.]